MPIDYLGHAAQYGFPASNALRHWAPYILACGALKWYSSGTKNVWERELHGMVALLTGGTSGMGAYLARDLATRGAQVVLLVKSTSDGWLVQFIDDLREATNNQLIYAESCDLASLHSIRLFATKWIDNSPPRRLDMIVCCAAVQSPPTRPKQLTVDGVEQHWGINYLANYHLLILLSPAIRAQPPDRDFRIILPNCLSYAAGELNLDDLDWERPYPSMQPWKCSGASKLALIMFARRFQKTLEDYKRPDGHANNARCIIVNPGIVRTPMTRRFLTLGWVTGLFFYILLWPLWYLLFKDVENGAQTLLFALYSPECGHGLGLRYLAECKEQKIQRKEVDDEELVEKLWTESAMQIGRLEKQRAKQRATAKGAKTK